MKALAFTIGEYEARLAKVKKRIKQARAEALFVISEPNIVYLTGYEGFSAYVPQGLLVTLADPQPILIVREMDVLCAVPTVYLSAQNIIAYDEKLIGLGEAPVWRGVGETLRVKIRGGRLALERSAKGLTVDNYAALVAGLGVDAIVDGSGWVNAVRAIKSAAELDYMRKAGIVVDAALAAGVEAIGVGVRECDVAAAVAHKLCSGTPDVPGGPPVQGVTMPVGAVSNAPHLRWTDGVYKVGLQTNFEIGAYQRRYCCAVSRTAFLGKPSKRLMHIDVSVREAFEATLPALRSGARCCDAYREFWRVFGPAGIRKESRIGYGIGIDWGEGNYTLQDDDESVLMENTTLHFIVGVWEREEGYVFSETVHVTDKGAASFSQTPRRMFVID